MKHRIPAVVYLALATAIASPGLAKGAAKGAALLLPADSLTWNDVPGFPGLKMAVTEGNPEKGPSHFLIKFPDGFSAPLHHHSSDHYVTVLTGTMVLGVDGKETRLPAGSFFCFKGKKVHTTRAEAGAECMVAIDARSKWDVVPEGGKK